MKFLSLLMVAVALSGVSCERHEFEGEDGTRQLHEPHGSHGSHGSHDSHDHAGGDAH
jgi:hypothetical protein